MGPYRDDYTPVGPAHGFFLGLLPLGGGGGALPEWEALQPVRRKDPCVSSFMCGKKAYIAAGPQVATGGKRTFARKAPRELARSSPSKWLTRDLERFGTAKSRV